MSAFSSGGRGHADPSTISLSGFRWLLSNPRQVRRLSAPRTSSPPLGCIRHKIAHRLSSRPQPWPRPRHPHPAYARLPTHHLRVRRDPTEGHSADVTQRSADRVDGTGERLAGGSDTKIRKCPSTLIAPGWGPPGEAAFGPPRPGLRLVPAGGTPVSPWVLTSS